MSHLHMQVYNYMYITIQLYSFLHFTLSIHPSVRLSIHSSVQPSVCLSVNPFIHPFICLSRSFVCKCKTEFVDLSMAMRLVKIRGGASCRFKKFKMFKI